MTEEPKTCDSCEHLIDNPRIDMLTPEQEYEYFCGHDDLHELDSNDQAPFIGFFPVCPEWCPLLKEQEIARYFLELEKPPIMHYIIMQWQKAQVEIDAEMRAGEWKVIHYTHDFNDFERMIEKYPRDKGYVHMIDIGFIRSHEVLEKLKAMKARELQ